MTTAESLGLDRAGDWPLVGRAGELRLLTGLLSRPDARGIVVAGPAGVGKTRLALECLAQAERQGLATAHTSATRAASSLAFGAVAPLLPPAETAPGAADRSGLLRRFAAALAERAGGRRLVYVVDDAHLLDDSSATLIYQLAAAGAALIVMTVRSRERAPEPVVALWKDGLLDRLELGGLDGEAVEELLTGVLGGPVDRAGVARLAVRCEGNVLFLKELVLGALASGSLARDGGLWRLVGPLAPSERLVELVETRLATLDEADRALLEAVAVGEPLGTAELAAVGDLDRAETLERQGLLRSELDGRRLRFQLIHPLHGEVLRGRISALRARGLTRALADATQSAGGRREDDVLRLATWRLDAGGVARDVMLKAAVAARRRFDFPLAERLARAAVDAGAGFPAAVLAAQLASMAGRGQEAEAELSALAFEATDDDALGLVTVTRLDNFRYLGQFEDALRVAQEGVAAIADPGWREELTAKRAGLLLDLEGPAAATAVTEALRPQAAGRALVWCCLYSAFALGRTGRLDAAIEAADEGGDANATLTGRPLEWPPGVLLLARAEALGFAGRLEEAERLAEGEYRQAVAGGSLDAQAYAAWQLAKNLLAQGRLEAAARHGREAAALLRQLRRRVLLRDCLIPLATAEALRGQPERAAEVLAELDGLGLAPSRWTAVDLLQARAWTAVAGGDVPAGRALLEEAVAQGADVGDAVGQAAALHDLARLGHAKGVPDRLAAIAGEIDGELAATRASHAASMVGNDPVGLAAASSTFEALGAVLLAAEASADAAVALRRRGEPRAAATAERRAIGLADCCQGATTPALRAIETRSLLTTAEREVALLAASGRANKEIADQLGLSVRTVENRLHRIYEKLGIAGRPELAAALEQ